MPVQLNHTIVAARDPDASATFLAEVLGLPAPVRFGHFEANGHWLEVLTRPYGSL
jgi:catechol 2,3-dioxygenase-like lactoylglutathione lyase family enzyme